jgi:hypothetical protein
MTGQEIFGRDTAQHSGYGNLLFFLALRFDDDLLYPLLEKAESMGKRISVYNPTNDPDIFDTEITLEQIIFI